MNGAAAWQSCDQAAAGFGAKISSYAAGNIALSAHSALFSAY
jgi:hypothetical protein